MDEMKEEMWGCFNDVGFTLELLIFESFSGYEIISFITVGKYLDFLGRFDWFLYSLPVQFCRIISSPLLSHIGLGCPRSGKKFWPLLFNIASERARDPVRVTHTPTVNQFRILIMLTNQSIFFQKIPFKKISKYRYFRSPSGFFWSKIGGIRLCGNN